MTQDADDVDRFRPVTDPRQRSRGFRRTFVSTELPVEWTLLAGRTTRGSCTT